jgi:hypothetical protein
MKKTISFVLVLALGLVVEIAKADFALSETTVEHEPLRVLFIGNSFTNQIQGTLTSLIQASPYSESTIEYVAPDSWTLQQHEQSNNTMSKIRSSNWDFVVLQEQSFRATLPDERTQFYNAVTNLSEAIKESGAQVVLYMTWGWRYGDTYNPQISPDYETMQQILIEAYTEAAHQVDAIIAPVGIAWQRVRRNNPDLGQQLYQGDGYHPSYQGTFLVANVFYATLFGADPTHLGFVGSLSAEDAVYLKRQAREVCIPNADFNGDGIVDADDMCVMIDYWGTDEPLCDIGPMPWGDGIVDTQDLIVLAEHLFTYPGAVAYWKLDETEGEIARDSVGDNDALLMGNPAWQPAGGIVDGALAFDGVDDYVSTPFILNPADGEFSVFAWIKGGAPGQVIVSQEGGADWLLADVVTGTLMTGLVQRAGRFTPPPLVSQVIITDGNWHRAGFTWDGRNRTLYVDDVLAAEDTQTGLVDSPGGLLIGCGKDMVPGTLWEGLIDDVRIYNRAVKP